MINQQALQLIYGPSDSYYINEKPNIMMTLIAIFFPSLSFLLRGKLLTALLSLILQITLIGWIPAAIWAVVSLQNSRADRRNAKLIKTVKSR